MFKTRYPIPGESPGVLRPREEAANRRPIITLIECHLPNRLFQTAPVAVKRREVYA
jgi:hypothetical protein